MSQSVLHCQRKRVLNKTRRGINRNFVVDNRFRIVGCNANGISSKLQSLDHLILTTTPSVICLQETKNIKAGRIKCENSRNFIIFELNRKDSKGGGLCTICTMVKPDLNPVWVSEGSDEVELLVIEIHIETFSVRVINAYAPQECDNLERKSAFWARLHQEVIDAEETGCAVIIQMDGNLHAGETIIPNDPNPINKNGRLFSTFLGNNPSINLLNSSEKCEGPITRSRKKGNKIEEAVLDFVLVSEELEPFVKTMKIDEERSVPLTSYLNKRAVNSDHFTTIVEMDINFRKQKKERLEQFNFKSTEGLETYKYILENEDNLVKSLEAGEDLETQTVSWFSELNKIFSRSFKIIRIRDTPRETETSKLFKERSDLIQKSKREQNNEKVKEDIEQNEAKISEIVAKENCEKIKETFSKVRPVRRVQLLSGHLESQKQNFSSSFSFSTSCQERCHQQTHY